MDLLDIIKNRRTIRKYQDKQISNKDLQKIIEAGLYAPNAGGRQGTLIYAVHNKELSEKIGKLNLMNFDRSKLLGGFVSKEQPSNIDDPNIKNGFYGAPTICVLFGPENFLYSIPDAFCCAENMILEAYNLGIASSIIARGEETFNNPIGEDLLKQWNVPEGYIARCFVILGYIDGEYPQGKPRKDGRYKIIE